MRAGSGPRAGHSAEKTTAAGLRGALKGAPKLLLSASPMQNSLLDLYHLIRFIDETAWDGYYWEVAYSPDFKFDENDMLIL